jgi:hypothetical protein
MFRSTYHLPAISTQLKNKVQRSANNMESRKTLKKWLYSRVSWQWMQRRRYFTYGRKLSYFYACTVKPSDILQAKNAFQNLWIRRGTEA